MTDAQAVCVDPALVSQVWPVAKEMIRAAYQRTRFPGFEECEQAVLDGRWLLWLAWDGHVILAAAVTRIDLAENSKIGIVVACGGSDVKRFISLRKRLEDHFREEGCARSRIFGRKGWRRHYPDYQVTGITMEKVL